MPGERGCENRYFVLSVDVFFFLFSSFRPPITDPPRIFPLSRPSPGSPVSPQDFLPYRPVITELAEMKFPNGGAVSGYSVIVSDNLVPWQEPALSRLLSPSSPSPHSQLFPFLPQTPRLRTHGEISLATVRFLRLVFRSRLSWK